MGRINSKFDTKNIAFTFYWCFNRRCNVCLLREIDPNKIKCKNFVIQEVFRRLEDYSNFLSLSDKEIEKKDTIEELKHCFKWCIEDDGNCEKCGRRGY